MAANNERLEDYIFITCPKKIAEGRRKLDELLSDVDQEKVQKLIEEQVLIVGGSRITFQRVDQNLKSCLIEYSLLKELADLYEWRRNFFDEHLPVLKGSWFTSSYCRDAITYNVLKNFDQILKIVSSRKLLEGSFPRGIILQSDEDKTRFERYRIDNFEFLYHTLRKKVLWTGYFLTESFIPGSYLRYNDLAMLLLEQHARGPKTLQQLSLKVIKRNGLNQDDIPGNVLVNDTLGVYNPHEQPQPLTTDGHELFLKLNKLFIALRKDHRW